MEIKKDELNLNQISNLSNNNNELFSLREENIQLKKEIEENKNQIFILKGKIFALNEKNESLSQKNDILDNSINKKDILISSFTSNNTNLISRIKELE